MDNSSTRSTPTTTSSLKTRSNSTTNSCTPISRSWTRWRKIWLATKPSPKNDFWCLNMKIADQFILSLFFILLHLHVKGFPILALLLQKCLQRCLLICNALCLGHVWNHCQTVDSSIYEILARIQKQKWSVLRPATHQQVSLTTKTKRGQHP